MRRSRPIADANAHFNVAEDESADFSMARARGGRTARAVFTGLIALVPMAAPAQNAPHAKPPQNTPLQNAPPQNTAPLAKPIDLDKQKAEFQGVRDTLAQSEAQRKKIEAEIQSFQNDRAKLAGALIDARQKIDEAESQLATTTARIETLAGSEAAIRRSLIGRRDILASVLAALQRMGRKPPPALLTQPEDVLRAIRASMLLGAVLPELRAETEALASDLQDLTGLRAGIAQERVKLAAEADARRNERARLESLIAARQAAIGEAEGALAAERKRAEALAGQAASLQDLIARMEGELAGARAAAEKAKAAEEARARQTEAEAEEARRKFADAPKRDPARLAPAIAFAQAKGLLSLPANGNVIKYYGAPGEFGGAEKGLSLATKAQAIVSSPCDGYIAFSGPWRSYGQLLIVNAGGGYYVVMAGMARVDVAVGQFVLAGEPVGVMGDGGAQTAAAVAIGAAQPVLYVEFRKDGTAIDPGPWWAKPDNMRVRG
jgi:septal ring factor EnvC (AmiA/AmiB activator)